MSSSAGASTSDVKAIGLALRQAAFVLMAVLATALTLAACGTTPLALTATVPWRAIPASPTTTTTTTTTTLAPAPPCKASQLRARRAFGGVGLGNLATTVVLTNTGTRCRLGGYPVLVGISRTRGRVPLAAKPGGTYFGNLVPADLAKGQSGRLLLGTEDACDVSDPAVAKANSYTKIVIVFPNSEGSLIAPTYSFDPRCGLDEAELGVIPPPPGVPVPPPPGSPGLLTATVHLPKTARSGEVLTYTVSLHNPTHVPIDLHQCPDYTEILGYPFNTVRTYTLNCSDARPISPGQTRVFEMKIPTPKVTKTTTAKFAWQLDTSLEPFTGGVLQLVPTTEALSSASASSRPHGRFLSRGL